MGKAINNSSLPRYQCVECNHEWATTDHTQPCPKCSYGGRHRLVQYGAGGTGVGAIGHLAPVDEPDMRKKAVECHSCGSKNTWHICRDCGNIGVQIAKVAWFEEEYNSLMELLDEHGVPRTEGEEEEPLDLRSRAEAIEKLASDALQGSA